MTHFNPFFSTFVGGGYCLIPPNTKTRRMPSKGLSNRFFGWVRDALVILAVIL